LIDWGGSMVAPALYDLGSAVMYVGTEKHIAGAYLAERSAMAAEVSVGLHAFLRFRYAVQAAYFAWRINTNVETGLSTIDGNLIGLSDARRMLGT
jgi:hypothetical protein